MTVLIFSATNEEENINMEILMIHKTQVFREDWEVDSRLVDFGVTKAELMTVVHAAAGGRADTVLHDPITAGGLFAYIYGTRALRDVLAPKGWKIDRTDNIESIYNRDTGVRIIFQNTDSAADMLRDPKALSGKGAASERVVDLAQKNIFPEFDEEDMQRVNKTVWFFCVAVNGERVQAELSCPLAVEGGQFSGFAERIFILSDDEWLGPRANDDSDLQGEEFEVNITRK